jgi:hypothetical protein
VLQRLQLAGGSMRQGATATWEDGEVPDKSAQPEELAGQERSGFQLLEVERLQRLCNGTCQGETDVCSSSSSMQRHALKKEEITRRMGPRMRRNAA